MSEAINSPEVSGIANGLSCGGKAESGGNLGSDSFVGLGKTSRGLSRSPSFSFRYVVKTSGRSVAVSSFRSRLHPQLVKGEQAERDEVAACLLVNEVCFVREDLEINTRG